MFLRIFQKIYFCIFSYSNIYNKLMNFHRVWDEVVKSRNEHEQRRTMRQEYDEYCYNLKISKIDVEKIKSNDFKEMVMDNRLMSEFLQYSKENIGDMRKDE